MSLFIVIRKPIKSGVFATNTKNPSNKELLNDLKSYPHVYLFNSLEDARKVAELFFHAPRVPQVGGSYGLIAGVKVEFTQIPAATTVDASLIYNNWVDSQKLGYVKKEETGVKYQCSVISPEQVKSISQTIIPDKVKVFNSNLKDTSFVDKPAKCLMM